MKIKKIKIRNFIFVITLSFISVLLFQNCSKIQSFTLVETPSEKEMEIGQPYYPESRTKVILPEVVGSQQINHKVKALLVVDNSATMAASQTSLSNQVSVLLEKLNAFDTEIQVVSSSYQADDGLTNTPSNFLFTTSTTTTPVSVQGYPGSASRTELTLNTIPTYKLDPSKSLAERQAITLEISNKIKSLGTQGSSSEAPFAVAAIQGQRFFNEGDRGLIFIITDEDDQSSVLKLSQPLFSIMESAETGETVPYSYTSIRRQASISTTSVIGSGECSVPITGQDGVIIGYETENVNMSFFSMAMCAAYRNCTLSCSEQTSIQDASGPGSCASVYLMPGQSLNSCSEETVTITGENPVTVIGQNRKNYPFEISEAQATGLNGERTTIFLNEFKTKVLSKLNEKYLISVSTSLTGQSCGLRSGQSFDNFFTRLKSSFPAQNFSISSICESNTNTAQQLDKIATDFLSIMNSKYLVGLANDEYIKSARIKTKASQDFVTIVEGVDFKIEAGQLVLQKPNLFDFERIELNIEKLSAL